MPGYVIFDSSTGAIKSLMSAPNESAVQLNISPGFDFMLFDQSGIFSQYKVNVSTSLLELKTSMNVTNSPLTITADGVDSSIVSGIEVGSCVEITRDNKLYLVDKALTSTLSFKTDDPGVHQIKFRHPLYLDTVIEITAVQP